MQIEIGDSVTVCWSNEDSIKGIVLYKPQATGDCWIIETENSIHHVQQFETIWKEKPNAVLSGAAPQQPKRHADEPRPTRTRG